MAYPLWQPNLYYPFDAIITDSNGNNQYVLDAGISAPIHPVWGFSGTTVDNAGHAKSPFIIWQFGLPPGGGGGGGSGVTSLNAATGAITVVGGTNTTVSTLGTVITVASASSQVIGSGATLTATGSGKIEATDLRTTGADVNVSNSAPPTHAGEILISQPGNTTAVWADPLVQGLQATGTAASTVNPVLVGGSDGTTLHNLVTDTEGDLEVRPAAPKLALWSHVAISFSSLGANVVVSGGGGQTIRVMRLLVVNNGASTNLTFQDTAPTSFTGAMTITTNGWIAMKGNGEPYFVTGASQSFQIYSSVATQISGIVYYTLS